MTTLVMDKEERYETKFVYMLRLGSKACYQCDQFSTYRAKINSTRDLSILTGSQGKEYKQVDILVRNSTFHSKTDTTHQRTIPKIRDCHLFMSAGQQPAQPQLQFRPVQRQQEQEEVPRRPR
jgi:hypothetical protein